MDTNINGSIPLVTILVATYNRAAYISQAIESAQAQTFKDWNMIVLDDASTDDTVPIVRAFTINDSRISHVRHAENKGIAGNRNAGLLLAQGTYVAILDSDDVWTDQNKLKRQIAYMTEHPDCVAVGTQVSVIDENGVEAGSISYETSNKGIRSHMLLRNQFAQSSILYRRNVAVEVGGYDATYVVNDDYDLWLKMGSKGTLANLSERMAAYREHSGGITKTKRLKAATEHLAIINRHGWHYPYYLLALLKSCLRILKALI